MACLARPFDTNKPKEFITLTKRTEDDLPPHVKKNVHWRTNLPAEEEEPSPGYYLWHKGQRAFKPVEFVENHWHKVYIYAGTAYTSLDNHIEPHTQGTSYWETTDQQHPHYYEHLSTLAQQATEIAQQLEADQAEALGRSAPTLTLDIGSSVPLAGEPSISAFITHVPSTAEDSSSDTEPAQSPEDQDPSPEQAQPEEPVLQAQFEHVLDIQDREPAHSSVKTPRTSGSPDMYKWS